MKLHSWLIYKVLSLPLAHSSMIFQLRLVCRKFIKLKNTCHHNYIKLII